MRSDHGWINLQNLFFERHHTATPRALVDHSAYARTEIRSEEARDAVLRISIDDWCRVWLNGASVATLRHDNGLEAVRLPVKLQRGSNELLLKTSNSETPPNNRLWVINCIVE